MVKIGEGMDGSAVRWGVAAGQKAPTFEVTDLASAQESTWEAPADRETLVVFGSLWHPASRDFVTAADGWSQRNKVDLQVVSCDWALAQAKREADRLNLKSPVSFGGAGGMNALKAWGNSAAPLAALISKEGKISKVFKPGEF